MAASTRSRTAARLPSAAAASSTYLRRAASPTRLALYSAPTLRFPDDRRRSAPPAGRLLRLPETSPVKRTCMCSPTNHPGSFRCSLHKGSSGSGGGGGGSHRGVSSRLNARRSAMTNSLVRIGTVEGEWVKRALAAMIRPSSHQQRRRSAFRPRPSRLSLMSKSGD